MSGANILDKELNNIKEQMVEVTNLIKKQYVQVVEAVEKEDPKIALEVINMDLKVDDLTEEIDIDAIVLIAKYQPVATDLRRIITATKLASEFERVGDYTKNIAEYVITCSKLNSTIDKKVFANIKIMVSHLIKMIDFCRDAYVNESKDLAKKAAEDDDHIDNLYYQNFTILLNIFKEQKSQDDIEVVSKALILNKQIERAGDHLTNIAEEILFLIKGKRYNLD